MHLLFCRCRSIIHSTLPFPCLYASIHPCLIRSVVCRCLVCSFRCCLSFSMHPCFHTSMPHCFAVAVLCSWILFHFWIITKYLMTAVYIQNKIIHNEQIFWTTLLYFKILCTVSLMYTAILKYFSSFQNIYSLTTNTEL